ncbi:MAG: hypothetical protein R6W31_15150 [Bacteroidales bacterium]
MEIKYTIEILTKDIQDIGKLVENLQNSPRGSTLELDLALSKLRNVYDILTVIRTDLSTPGLLFRQAPEVESPKPVMPQPVMEIPVSEPVPEPVPVTDPPQPPLEAVAEVPQREPEGIVRKDSRIIADKFASESRINENLAANREHDLESKITGSPIDHIGRNIGINDRFLIIRELFDGDSDGFGKLIRDLDNAGSLQSAAEKLSVQFVNTPNHEGVVILSRLIKRRYSHS